MARKPSDLQMRIAKGPQPKLYYMRMGISAVCNWEVSWGSLQASSSCLIFPVLDFIFKDTLFPLLYLIRYIVLRLVLEEEHIFVLFLDSS